MPFRVLVANLLEQRIAQNHVLKSFSAKHRWLLPQSWTCSALGGGFLARSESFVKKEINSYFGFCGGQTAVGKRVVHKIQVPKTRCCLRGRPCCPGRDVMEANLISSKRPKRQPRPFSIHGHGDKPLSVSPSQGTDAIRVAKLLLGFLSHWRPNKTTVASFVSSHAQPFSPSWYLIPHSKKRYGQKCDQNKLERT